MELIFAKRCAAGLARLASAGALAALVAMWAPAMAQDGSGPARVGGGCDYVEVPGVATIVSIEKTPASSKQATVSGGPGYEGMDVRYRFAPSSPITDPQARTWAGKTHTLQLANSWYPGPRYIAKYDLVKGKHIDAVLKIRTKGTCTPYLIDFPDIDLTDYFETAAILSHPLRAHSTG